MAAFRFTFNNRRPQLVLEFRIHAAGRPFIGTLVFERVTIVRLGEVA